MTRMRSRLLWIDAFINFVLGGALLAFPLTVSVLGIPHAPSFYPTILGGVLFGIGLALSWEAASSSPCA